MLIEWDKRITAIKDENIQFPEHLERISLKHASTITGDPAACCLHTSSCTGCPQHLNLAQCLPNYSRSVSVYWNHRPGISLTMTTILSEKMSRIWEEACPFAYSLSTFAN